MGAPDQGMDATPPEADAGPQGHSGLGIASLIIGLLLGLLLCVANGFVIAVSIDHKRLKPAFATGVWATGFILSLAVTTGLILGIVGVIQKKKKRLFPAIGLVVNLIVLLVNTGLFITGFLMQAK